MKVHQLYILDWCILVYLEEKKASLSFEDKIQLNTWVVSETSAISPDCQIVTNINNIIIIVMLAPAGNTQLCLRVRLFQTKLSKLDLQMMMMVRMRLNHPLNWTFDHCDIDYRWIDFIRLVLPPIDNITGGVGKRTNFQVARLQSWWFSSVFS